MAKNKNTIETVIETVTQATKPVHPVDALAPVFSLVAEILTSALSAVAKNIAMHFLLDEKKQIDTAVCAKHLRLPYMQAHLACKDLQRAGLLKPVASDLWEVTNPFDLRGLVDAHLAEKNEVKSE